MSEAFLNVSKRFGPLTMVVLMTGASGGPMAAAATIYDSAGFEAPRFSAAPTANALAGQDPIAPVGQGPWTKDSGGATAVVQTNTPKAGLQAVEIQRPSGAGNDTRWSVAAPVTPTASLSVVAIAFDMSVNIPGSLTHGPLFGIEAYDGTGAGAKLIGGLTLDAAQGAVLYDAATTGTPTLSNTYLSRNTYHHYELAADFTTKTYAIYADGTLLHTEPFVDSTATAFAQAPLVTLTSPTLPINDTGTAFFDNYSISQVAAVPEPTQALFIGLGAAGWMLRRRGK